MSKIKVMILFGKMAAGKDTIQNWVINHTSNVKKIVSCTTRSPRDYEIEGVDYHFLSVPQFTEKVLNGEMLEAVEFGGNFYGAAIDSLDPEKINLGVMELDGIHALLEDPRLDVRCVYVGATAKNRLLRYLNREQDVDCTKMCVRFLEEEELFGEFDFDYDVIPNNEYMDEPHFPRMLEIINDFGQE